MVKLRHRGRLIYFHTGMVPSEEAIEAAFAITHNVAFRSVDYYAPGALEKADAVAGEKIPEPYVKAYPVVKSAGEFTKVLNPKATTETEEPEKTPDTEAEKDKGKGKGTKTPEQPPAPPQTGGGPNWNPQT